MAQKKPMKWGEISDEDLNMTSWPGDTNAVAVILGEYGEAEVNGLGEVYFEYHLRIKLLSESAYDEWATFEVPFISGRNGEKIRKLAGQTVKMVDGKRKRVKAGKDAIFKEKLTDDVDQMKLTFPGLEPGAVVEVRYQLSSENPHYLPDWDFQHSEPTRWSEYRTTISDAIGYTQLNNVSTFAVEESEPVVTPRGRLHQYRWVMEDVPALREEPFITTLEDYRYSVEFQFSSYFDPGQGIVKVLDTWDKLAERLREIESFEQAFKASGDIRRKAAELTEGLTDPAEKLDAIDRFVRGSIAWDGTYRIYDDIDLDNVLKNSSGSAGGHALLLTSLLREAGIDANPVLVSTRSNGKIKKVYPQVSQFNYLITHVALGGKEMLIDTTQPQAPMDLLPLRAINGQGWMVTKSANRWVKLYTDQKYFHLITLEGEMDDAGVLTGQVKSSSKGYRAQAIRAKLADEDPEELSSEVVLEVNDDIEMTDLEIEGLDDPTATLKLSLMSTFKEFGQQVGDFIYIGTQPVGRIEENPLRLPTRKYPVDMGYQRDFIYTFRILMPQGFEVEELPADVQVRLAEKGGLYQRKISIMDGFIVMQSRMTFSKPIFLARYYQELRAMYDRVVAAHSDQIVLKRTSS